MKKITFFSLVAAILFSSCGKGDKAETKYVQYAPPQGGTMATPNTGINTMPAQPAQTQPVIVNNYYYNAGNCGGGTSYHKRSNSTVSNYTETAQPAPTTVSTREIVYVTMPPAQQQQASNSTSSNDNWQREVAMAQIASNERIAAQNAENARRDRNAIVVSNIANGVLNAGGNIASAAIYRSGQRDVANAIYNSRTTTGYYNSGSTYTTQPNYSYHYQQTVQQYYPANATGTVPVTTVPIGTYDQGVGAPMHY